MVFLYGFPKSQRSNINKLEKEALKKLADEYLSYSNELLNKTIKAKELTEVFKHLLIKAPYEFL